MKYLMLLVFNISLVNAAEVDCTLKEVDTNNPYAGTKITQGIKKTLDGNGNATLAVDGVYWNDSTSGKKVVSTVQVVGSKITSITVQEPHQTWFAKTVVTGAGRAGSANLVMDHGGGKKWESGLACRLVGLTGGRTRGR